MVNPIGSDFEDKDLVSDFIYALGNSVLSGGPDNDNEIAVVITTSFERNSMYNGKLYSAGSLVNNVRDGESTFFFIENPSDSASLIDIDQLVIRTGGKAIVTLTQDPTVDTPGSPATVRNKRTGSSDTTEATITVGGAYSGGQEEEDILLPASEGEERLGGEASDRFVLIDKGDSVLIEVFNDSGRTVDQEIKIKYSEVDV